MFGPQGSGKGTQAHLLAKRYQLPIVGVGDLLRAEQAKGTQLGNQIGACVDKGELVPDELVNNIVKEYTATEVCRDGFIVDGYPRTIGHYTALMSFSGLDDIVELVMPKELSYTRIKRRVICSGCTKSYHTELRPPMTPGACDECGGTLVHRSDDTPEAIAKRLDIYYTVTHPIIDQARADGVRVHSIDATPSPEEVFARIVEALER